MSTYFQYRNNYLMITKITNMNLAEITRDN